MRKIQHLLFVLFLVVNLCLSNTNYFPLTVGNYWVYSDDLNPNIITYYSIFDTTIVDNKVYYNYGQWEEYPSKYFRWDSTGILYNYNFSFQSEHVWFDFTTVEGETTSVYVADSTFLYNAIVISDSISVTCPVGTFENCKLVLFDDPRSFDEEVWYWFAPNVGIVKKVRAWFGSMSLTAAQVDSLVLSIDLRHVPEVISLLHIFPNPFNPTTTVEFTMPMSELVTLRVYDVKGREVETLVDKRLDRGIHSVVWNGSSFPSGIYFIRMENSRVIQTQKVLLLK